jgi:hypothetical protein
VGIDDILQSELKGVAAFGEFVVSLVSHALSINQL